ncbi:glycosyltransferase family 2 protein [Desulfogranum mediterraneum]|uniref:glycosyltransferase family 2 protein n=1 Tax=Desulfogranum mediterraneum TaxID=160661 RepID=UPI0012947F9A|nr:glycosyltransferase family 2 protein [Desulfogranum mediterraneum]
MNRPTCALLSAMTSVATVIVSHNSGLVLGTCLQAVAEQSLQSLSTVVVDAGSSSSVYLDRLQEAYGFRLEKQANLGFSRANNLGYALCPVEAELILFLNPDAFMAATTLEQAVGLMAAQPEVGCLTARLLGYDIEQGRPTGLLDSTGIFRSWYGRWYDRGQGREDRGQFDRAEEVPAACGAFMLCRRTALDQVALDGGAVFDPDFFLYKEDIELSLRLRKQGWKIGYAPELQVYHGRGWQRRRSRMSLALRRIAAKNEILLYRKHPSCYILWALVKYLGVRGLGL